MAELKAPSETGYAGAADTWAANATLAYAPLARRLVGRCPIRLEGADALDAGAGTGVAGDALRDAGATVVACDLELDMMRFAGTRAHDRDAATPHTAVADVTALPFRDGAFDACAAAFVINHLADPVAGLGELRRVTHRGGVVLASTFSVARAAAKAAVDTVAASYGFEQPLWYRELHRRAETTGTTERMSAALSAAGFEQFELVDEPADVGLDDPALVVRYRLGLPHLHRFAATLSPARRARFVADATRAVAHSAETFRPNVIDVVAIA